VPGARPGLRSAQGSHRDFLDRFHDEALALARPPRAQQKSFILPASPPVQALQQVPAGLVQNIAKVSSILSDELKNFTNW
jgi:hypothetical protein